MTYRLTAHLFVYLVVTGTRELYREIALMKIAAEPIRREKATQAPALSRATS